jgi:hypothetical protein
LRFLLDALTSNPDSIGGQYYPQQLDGEITGMNRIYQGKVTAVEIPDGKDPQGKTTWKKLNDWQSALPIASKHNEWG